MFLLFAAYYCLATSISANKILLSAISPELLVTLRMVGSSFLLYGLEYMRTRTGISWCTIKAYILPIATIALCTTFIPSNLKAFSLANMPSAKMAYFGTLDPFIAALYSFLWAHERLTVRQWSGIFLGTLGTLTLVADSAPSEELFSTFFIFSLPELAALSAIIISRIGYIWAQEVLRKEEVTPVQFTVMNMAMGGFFSALLFFFSGTRQIGSLSQAMPILHYWPISLLSAYGQLLFFLTYTIGVGNIIGYTLYAHTLKRYSATFIALAGFSIPLLVQLVGWIFLAEPLSQRFFLACGITFLGVLLFFFDEV